MKKIQNKQFVSTSRRVKQLISPNLELRFVGHIEIIVTSYMRQSNINETENETKTTHNNGDERLNEQK